MVRYLCSVEAVAQPNTNSTHSFGSGHNVSQKKKENFFYFEKNSIWLLLLIIEKYVVKDH